MIQHQQGEFQAFMKGKSPDQPSEPLPMIIDLQQRSLVLIDLATDVVLSDLKQILVKDLSKRLVELTQFSIFEQWLEKQHFSGAGVSLFASAVEIGFLHYTTRHFVLRLSLQKWNDMLQLWKIVPVPKAQLRWFLIQCRQ